MSQNSIQTAFSPIFNKFAWQTKLGYGSFFTLEFGEPRLRVREPIIPNAGLSDQVSKQLRRRLVTVSGERHIWVQYAHWKISGVEFPANSQSGDRELMARSIEELDGQRLLSLQTQESPPKLQLFFDLGANIDLWPDENFPDEEMLVCYFDGGTFEIKSDQKVLRVAVEYA